MFDDENLVSCTGLAGLPKMMGTWSAEYGL
jgi:hypothetical protein